MVKIYSMSTCPDCTYVYEQVKNDESYAIIDIGSSVKNLKEFLKLRDTHSIFQDAKNNGTIGIPCFILNDGTITLTPEEAGLKSRSITENETCTLNGNGC